MLPAPGGISPVHLTDSVSKASYAVGDGLYPADQRNPFHIVQLIEEADETLFNNIRRNPFHILQHILPKQIDYCYSLKAHTHNHDNKKFIDRMLLRNPCSLA